MRVSEAVEAQAQIIFKDDICWNKCRQRGVHTRTQLVFGGSHILHACTACARNEDASVLMRIAIKVDDFYKNWRE